MEPDTETKAAQSFDLMIELEDDFQAEVTADCGCRLESTEWMVGFIFCDLHRKPITQSVETGAGFLSDAEINLLSLLLQTHGSCTVLAALAIACQKLVGEIAGAGELAASQHWHHSAELFFTLAALSVPNTPAK